MKYAYFDIEFQKIGLDVRTWCLGKGKCSWGHYRRGIRPIFPRSEGIQGTGSHWGCPQRKVTAADGTVAHLQDTTGYQLLQDTHWIHASNRIQQQQDACYDRIHQDTRLNYSNTSRPSGYVDTPWQQHLTAAGTRWRDRPMGNSRSKTN